MSSDGQLLRMLTECGPPLYSASALKASDGLESPTFARYGPKGSWSRPRTYILSSTLVPIRLSDGSSPIGGVYPCVVSSCRQVDQHYELVSRLHSTNLQTRTEQTFHVLLSQSNHAVVCLCFLRLHWHIFIAHFLLRRKFASVNGHFLTHFPRRRRVYVPKSWRASFSTR